MKTLFLVLICNSFFQGIYAQIPAVAEPAYKRIPTVPPFNITQAPDSVSFTKAQLKNRRAVIIMIFSPDCDHCVHAVNNLVTNINLFHKTQLVLVSSLSYKAVKKFYEEMKLSQYSNIIVGYDATRFLSSFYEIKNFPSIFLYDKKGNFKADFSDHPDFKLIAKDLK